MALVARDGPGRSYGDPHIFPIEDDLFKVLTFIHKLVTFIPKYLFYNKYYIQNEGLVMGPPLSSILSGIYLNHIENTYVLSDSNRLLDKLYFIGAMFL